MEGKDIACIYMYVYIYINYIYIHTWAYTYSHTYTHIWFMETMISHKFWKVTLKVIHVGCDKVSKGLPKFFMSTKSSLVWLWISSGQEEGTFSLGLVWMLQWWEVHVWHLLFLLFWFIILCCVFATGSLTTVTMAKTPSLSEHQHDFMCFLLINKNIFMG